MVNASQIEDVVKKERSRLLNFIRQRISSKEEAEDILQDVFYRLIENFAEIETAEKVTAWLFASTRNRIIDSYRKHTPDSFSDIERASGDGDDAISLAEILPDTSALPDGDLIMDDIMEEVEEALDELPEEQKEVFVLHEFEGYSFKEISAMLNVPVNTLLSRKRYAVLYLRNSLHNLYKEITT